MAEEAPVFSLSGRTALISGASRGIGEAIARRFVKQGARVILAARSVMRLQELAEELVAEDGEVHVLSIDLADTESIGDRLKELPASFADVDILVNNAGVTQDNLLARMTLEQWDQVLRTNLTGAYALTRGVVRGMMRRRWGRVVTISSVVAMMGNAGQANYAASKAGLIGFSKSLARELASRNVTVNVVAPGFIETAMTEALPDKARDELFASIPIGRLGSPGDVAAAVVFLASEEAGYVTGDVLNVSGGLYI